MIPTENRVADRLSERKPNPKIDYASIVVFLIPALQFIHIRVVGTLDGSDVLLLLVFVVLAVEGKLRIQAPTARRLLIFCLLWLVSQVVTDVVRHTSFRDYARGWSNIGFTLVSFAVIYMLVYGRPKRMILYGWGLIIGSLLTYFISPSDYALEEPWKFGFAFPVTFAVLLIASRKDVRGNWPVLLTIAVGILDVFLGSRSAGAVCIVSGLYLLIVRSLRRRGLIDYRLTAGKLVVIAITALITGVGIYAAYTYAASTGRLGEEALHKYQLQSSGKYGILLGGRTELLAAVPAIIDSPILGHGSSARNPAYILAQRQALAIMGYQDAAALSPEELQEGIIPTHSYILGAWVDGGIVGALFWIWVWWLTAKMLLRSYPASVLIPPAVPWFAFQLLWNIPFSPYGGAERVVAPFYLVVLIGFLSIPQFQKGRVISTCAVGQTRTA